MKKYRVSVDIGGTFTDFVFYDSELQDYKTGKVLTTPHNLSEAIMTGLNQEIEDYGEIEFFVHGTTAGLNAFLERKGARVALITTKGFRDVYEIARGNRPELYNITYRKPTPLIERKNVFEVKERVLSNGNVMQKLSEESFLEVIRKIQDGDFESIAVCLVNAYINPVHEIEIGNLLQKHLPDHSISLSHVIAREWREYERTSTTVLNAYIAPRVHNYLDTLKSNLKSNGFGSSVYIMQSNGGIMTSEIAKDSPIQTLLSGPVGGAIGNNAIAEKTDFKNLIGIDMGGTSFDVSMMIDGRPDVSTETSLEGFPILTPMVNIYTIGAGGGSIAWLEGGGLRVGPHSAGADPGPACYRKGGQEPTVTDANLILGRIDPNNFLSGNMILDRKASEAAIKRIAPKLNLSITETAQGIIDIANAKMADAIRQLTIQKGIDPREFVLVAFGGAGPMHAVSIAKELNIGKVLVPSSPGAFSAWGMHQSDIRQDSVRTMNNALDNITPEKLKKTYEEMKNEVQEILLQQNIEENKIEHLRTADLRYIGQEYTVNVEFMPGSLDQSSLDSIKQAFHNRHEQIYGHSNTAGAVEIVNLRLAGIGKVERVIRKKAEAVTNELKHRKVSSVIFGGSEYDTNIYDRAQFQPGQSFEGPAIIEELSSTTVIPPGCKINVDSSWNLIIENDSQ